MRHRINRNNSRSLSGFAATPAAIIPCQHETSSVGEPMCSPTNLFANVPAQATAEDVATLVESPFVRVERIVSHGHASPAGFWYDQPRDEWVLLLKGRARLEFEGADRPTEMQAGEYLRIPAHVRHRVEWTTPDEPTVWLAIHYADGSATECSNAAAERRQ
jgi:cupin 2 domain-containing protein